MFVRAVATYPPATKTNRRVSESEGLISPFKQIWRIILRSRGTDSRDRAIHRVVRPLEGLSSGGIAEKAQQMNPNRQCHSLLKATQMWQYERR